MTGSSSGFGLEGSKALALRGHTVFASMRGVHGRNGEVADSLTDFAETHDAELRVVELDVTDPGSVEAAVDGVLAESDGLDVLINNAGQMYLGVTEAFTPGELQRQLDVNVVGPFRLCRSVLPHMRDRGEGLIVNVSSTAGRVVVPFFGVYHASKWALEALSESLRYELAPLGVDVTILEPGPFTTNLFPSTPRPGDRDREEAYGPVRLEMNGVEEAFEATFDDPDAPTDPQLVVDAFVELVEAAPGERPLRTVVGIDFGVRELNAATEPFQEGVLEALGLGHMAGVAAARTSGRTSEG